MPREHGIPYRLIPIYVENSQLQETIDFEASLEQGKMIMSAGLLDDTSTRCWVVDDGHILAPEVRHALLVEAKRRQILLIMTINHEDRTLDDAEGNSSIACIYGRTYTRISYSCVATKSRR